MEPFAWSHRGSKAVQARANRVCAARGCSVVFARCATASPYDRRVPRPYAAVPTCHLYLLPLLHEDIAKVGISVDPLARVRAFSSRYYECFDLERSLLVAFDSVREARRRETALHRALRPWHAPAPLTVPLRAGGGTEWYRGAWPQLRDAASADAALGHPAWLPAGDWWRARLQAEQARLYEWAEACLRDVPDDAPVPPAHWSRVVDVLDAWPALGLDVSQALPEAMAGRYRRHRAAWRGTLDD